jgi:TolB protein
LKLLPVIIALPVCLLAADFLPMTPIGAQCLPVSVRVEGSGTEAVLVRDQLVFDIDFSGLLITVPEEEAYVRLSVRLTGREGNWNFSARAEADGEGVLVKEYQGSSLYDMVHALSDDLVFALTGEQGIASTRIAYITRGEDEWRLVSKTLDPRQASTIMRDNQVITTPDWSPLGDKIAFTSYRTGTGDIYTYSFSTGSASRILYGGGNTAPAWSPDGRYIAFTRSESGVSDIWLYDTGGGGSTRLTARSSIETSASFSPNGLQIIFTSDRVGYPQLYWMSASGGSAERAGFSHGYCDSPAWSPRGDQIAYCARAAGGFHIFVMNADGTNIRQVTTRGTMNEDPVWSPTGRHLAFSSNMDGVRSIYIMELNGMRIHRLSPGGESYCPAWSPVF